MQSTKCQSLIQSMLCSLQNVKCFFSTTLIILATTPIITINNFFFYLSQFSSPYFTSQPVHKTIFTNLPTLPSIPQPFLPPYFYFKPSLQPPSKIFSPTSIIQLIQAVSMAQLASAFSLHEHCINLSLDCQSMGRGNSTQYH